MYANIFYSICIFPFFPPGSYVRRLSSVCFNAEKGENLLNSLFLYTYMLPLCRAHRQSALRMGVEIIFSLSDSLEYYILLRQENCLPIFFIFSLRKWLLSLSLCRCRCLRHTQSYTINFLPLNLFAL